MSQEKLLQKALALSNESKNLFFFSFPCSGLPSSVSQLLNLIKRNRDCQEDMCNRGISTHDSVFLVLMEAIMISETELVLLNAPRTQSAILRHWEFEERSCENRCWQDLRSCSPSVPWDTVSIGVWELKHKPRARILSAFKSKQKKCLPKKRRGPRRKKTCYTFRKDMYEQKRLGKLFKKWKDFSSCCWQVQQ